MQRSGEVHVPKWTVSTTFNVGGTVPPWRVGLSPLHVYLIAKTQRWSWRLRCGRCAHRCALTLCVANFRLDVGMRARPTAWVIVGMLFGTSCSGSPGDGKGRDGSAAGDDSGASSADGGDVSSRASEVAARLGRPGNFLIGMGNDLAADHDEDGAYTLGTTLDLHYAYLVGLLGQGGWPDWNAEGSFVNILTDSADDHGVVPMFTLYSMAAWGESNLGALTNADYMSAYWAGAELLFERLAIFDGPAVVHFEPDFWAFAQQSSDGAAPGTVAAQVSDHVEACSDLPDDVSGMGRCLVRLARSKSPKVVIGFHASSWAGPTEDTIAFLTAMGAGSADIIVVETLDRDAGCFEAGVDPACSRDDGPWYWDETNQTSPNFSEHLSWAKEISDGLELPLMWWQLPFGVPSDTPGGTAGQYRDNRVRYLFSHPDEFVAAGGVGAVFGVGASNQTYITTDGDQFKNAVADYFADPEPL